ncbi:MAG: AI-2E family transporter [Candidatus Eisenbacteria bacterium]|nr:AI-2E family transporter [Candidatus Latescibacterota bacterium]MBD3301520.1 AI-2E family transporter [Candidatus Eisenbacteria bacterium]
MDRERFRRIFLILLVIVISLLFVAMIRPFLLALLLAAVFSGLAHPLYRRILRRLGGRRSLASATTLLFLLVVVLVPLLALLGLVAGEALRISESVTPWIREQLRTPDLLIEKLEQLPGVENLEPYRNQILTKAGEIVGSIGTFLFTSLSATTRGTVAFLFQLFLMLYAMYFFLMDGQSILRRILDHIPLDETDERRMVGRFTSVTRATLKGTLLIGLLQGGLAGIAFWAVGIDGAIFWGALMVVLSIIPGIGTGLVWVPAAILLIARGDLARGILLAAFCGFVVGSVDNFLRPRIVGRDTRMHELLVLLSTLGGLVLFGVVGFIVGPILAALFTTIWEIFGAAFREYQPLPTGGPAEPPRPVPDDPPGRDAREP